jgi:lysophospholipase L1-like esterase
VINVTVTAIGGEDSVAGAARFKRDVLSHRPDVVTLDYALNDRRIGLAKARKAWISMIRAAQQAGVRIILMTPTPDTKAHLDDPADPLNQHAGQIRKLASEFRAGLVDSLELFKAQIDSGQALGDFMAQANHPNRQGHELVAAELAKWFTAPAPAQKKAAPAVLPR